MSFIGDLLGENTSAPTVSTTPSGFAGGGMNGSFSGNTYSVTADPSRTGQVSTLSNTFGSLGDQTGDLRATVAPGYNDLLKARLTDLDNQGTAAIGNLKQNLQSRRILGSSFGQDTISRANNTIQQQRDATIADNFQQSLTANNNLLTQQYAAYAKQYQTGLDELNLEATTASGLSSKASDILAANAQLTAKLNEQSQEFNGKMANTNATGVGNFLGKVGTMAMAA